MDIWPASGLSIVSFGCLPLLTDSSGGVPAGLEPNTLNIPGRLSPTFPTRADIYDLQRAYRASLEYNIRRDAEPFRQVVRLYGSASPENILPRIYSCYMRRGAEVDAPQPISQEAAPCDPPLSPDPHLPAEQMERKFKAGFV